MKTLGSLYQKDITRYLEGVIKADDESHLAQEIEEYVLTGEVTQLLYNFFEIYNNGSGTNGVWISGFFGSGKSHLLKMLSYLLENKTLKTGKKVGDIFLEKVEENALLKAEILKALKQSTKSILFNIDQKTEESTKKTTNPILSVFAKVFNEMQGYYGGQGYIAEFERDLDRNELFGSFKKTYEEISGRSWELGREEVLLNSDIVGKAIYKVKGLPINQAENLIFKYEEQYNISPESFAERVAIWLNEQQKGFRINFLVDEIGQYISGQTKLMLNLQTIAETLATKCNGRAWVIVTSQQDIDGVVGTLNTKHNNDFSRIQDRFAVKLNLTSKNADEVIMKRLFAKKTEVEPQLSALYQKEHNNIKTLVQFEGGRKYRGYQDERHFIQAYPVFPYQFPLLKSANEELAMHQAFLGRHRSVGERSLMDVFKTSGKETKDKILGSIIPFDMGFDGFRPTLKSHVQSAINIAESNLDDSFAIRVLKALFLVKYVKEFKATARNIAILLIDNLQISLKEHNQKVKDALNKLEEEIYIQRNGEEYEFLTNEEKDIEAEIKNTDISTDDVVAFLRRTVFDEILRDKSIRYPENKEDYSFTRKLDGLIYGREQELSIHIITPLYDQFEYRDSIVSGSMGRPELLMILAEDKRLEMDTRLFLQTERYIRHHQSTQHDQVRQSILANKRTQNTQRKTDLIRRLELLIGGAEIYIHGQKQDLAAQDSGKNRIHLSFQQLISKVYLNLRMIKTQYTENDIKQYLTSSKERDLFGGELGLNESEEEILNYLLRQQRSGTKLPVKSLIAFFTKIPYGWGPNTILAILARLIRRNKVEIEFEGQEIIGRELVNKLNNRYFDRLLIEPIISVDKGQLIRLHKFHKKMFHESNPHNDAKAAAIQTQKAFQEESKKWDKLLSKMENYPFIKDLEPIKQEGAKILRLDWRKIFEVILQKDHLWLDWKEEIIDPLTNFMNSKHKSIYDDVKSFLGNNKANIEYLEKDEELEQLKSLVEHEKPFQVGQIQSSKQTLESLKEQLKKRLQQEIMSATNTYDELLSQIKQTPEYSQLDENEKNKINSSIDRIKDEVINSQYIPVILEKVSYARTRLFDKLLADMISMIAQKAKIISSSSENKNENSSTSTSNPPLPSYKVYRKGNIQISFPINRLRSKDDVEAYVEVLREKYLHIIANGDQIDL